MENFIQGSFSIAVAAFLLIRVEKQLSKLTEAISLLRHCQVCRLSIWRVAPVDVVGDDEDDLAAVAVERE